MPTGERARPDDHQSVLPVEQPRPQCQTQPGSVGERPRSDLALSIEGELFSEKQILGRQTGSGPQSRPQEVSEVANESEEDRNERSQALHGSGILPDEQLN